MSERMVKNMTYLVTSCNYFFETFFLQLLPILSIAVEVRHATLNSQDRGWGPARHAELAGSRLRSGTPHWTHELAVGVRHATLNSRARGWGPARHTELTGSRLGSGTPHWTHESGTPHWTHELAVEVRHATLNSQDRGWGPAHHMDATDRQRDAEGGEGRGGGRGGEGEEGGGGGEETDIKSNNPHLTGGEKKTL